MTSINRMLSNASKQVTVEYSIDPAQFLLIHIFISICTTGDAIHQHQQKLDTVAALEWTFCRHFLPE